RASRLPVDPAGQSRAAAQPRRASRGYAWGRPGCRALRLPRQAVRSADACCQPAGRAMARREVRADRQRCHGAGLGSLARGGRRWVGERARVSDRGKRRRQLSFPRRLRQRRQGRQGDAHGRAQLARRPVEHRLPYPRRRAEAGGDRRPIPRDGSRLRQAALADEPAAAAAPHRPRLQRRVLQGLQVRAYRRRGARRQRSHGPEGFPDDRLGGGRRDARRRRPGAGNAEPARAHHPGRGRHCRHRAGLRQPGGGGGSGDRAARTEEPARADARLPIHGHRLVERPQGGAGQRAAPCRFGQGGLAVTRMAAVQMVSAPEVPANLEAAGRLIASAAAAGAKLVALPENFYIIGRHEGDKVKVREADGRGPIQQFLSEAARKHRLWILAGTVPISSQDGSRIRSACLLYDDAGRRVARYDKMHLFRFQQGAENYDEARTVEPGTKPLAVDTPFGRLGLSVCYDVRFPEVYRGLGEVDVIFVPSAFTVPTGAAHWETLLRARAIENQAYVVAPAQGGTHASGRRTYGHTMIIDPWGEVLGVQPEGEGVVLAEIDLEHSQQLRRRFAR